MMHVQHKPAVSIGSLRTALALVCVAAWALVSPALAAGPPASRLLELVPQVGIPTQAWEISFSADGKRLTCSGTYGNLVLVDIQTGQVLRHVLTGGDLAGGMAVDPTGRWLAADAGKSHLGLWDLITGDRVAFLSGHSRSITSVAFSRDGRRILTGAYDNRAILWDRATGDQVQSFLGPQSISKVALSPDGKQAATASYINEILLWDVDSGKRLRTIPCESLSVSRLAFSPDGRQLVILGARYKAFEQTVHWTLWETATGRKLLSHEGKDVLPDIAFSPDGKQLVYGGGEMLDGWKDGPGPITVWNVASGKKVRSFLAHDAPVLSLKFTPDGRQLFTSDGIQGILWDWATLKQIRTFDLGLWQDISSISLSGDGNTVLTAQTPPMIWELATGKTLHQFHSKDQLLHTALSADGRRMVAVGQNYRAKKSWLVTWDADRPSKLRSVTDLPFSVDYLAITPDGAKALTAISGFGQGVEKSAAMLWDVATGKRLQAFDFAGSSVAAIAISNDGRRIAVGDQEYKIAVFDAADGRKLHSLNPSSMIHTLVFSRDGQQLAVSYGYDNEAGISIWDVEGGKRLREAEACGDNFTTLAFSHDGRLLLGGAYHGRVLLWDATSGRKIRELAGHPSTVKSVSFVDAQARHALTADGLALRLWDVAAGDELATIYRIGKQGDWLAITPTGLLDGSPKALDRVTLRVGRGLDLGPQPAAIKELRRPGLIAQLLRGDRPQSATAPSKAPIVRIVSPQPKETTNQEKSTLEVELADGGAGFKAPWLWHDFDRLDSARPSSNRGRYTFTVNLAPGANRFEVHAVSVDGRWRSTPAVLVLDRKAADPDAPRPANKHPELVLQVGHSNTVGFTLLSPDGRTVATGADDQTVVLWDVDTRRQLHTLRDHNAGLTCGAFSPDGKRLVTADGDSTAIVWEVASGRRIRSLGHAEWQVCGAAYTADGRQIVTATNKQVCFWNAASGKMLRSISAGRENIIHMAISPKADRVVTAMGDESHSSAVLWEASSGRKLQTIAAPAGKKIARVAFTPDGNAVGLIQDPDSKQSQIVVWSAETGQELRAISDPTNFSAVAFSQDGKQAAAAAYNQILLWDPATGRKTREIQGLTTSLATVAISPDASRLLLCGMLKRPAIMVDAATRNWLYTFTEQDDSKPENVQAAAFSPDGNQFVVAAGHSAIIRDTATGREIRRWRNKYGDVHTVSYSADGKQILGCSSTNAATIWEASSGKKLRTFEASSWIQAAAISPNGRQVVTGGGQKSGELILWDVQSGEKLRTLRGHTIPVVSVAFSPDGRQVLSAASDMEGGSHNKAILWDVATGESVHVLSAGPKGCKAAAFSRDGRYVFTLEQKSEGMEPEGIVVWDRETGQRLRSLAGGGTGLESMALSNDGRLLLTGAYSQAILWDIEQGTVLNTYQGNCGEIHSLHFTADATHLLSGSGGSEDAALVWDVKTGHVVDSFRSRVAAVRAVAFSPDGKRVAAASDGFGGTIAIWDLTSGQIQTVLGGHGDREHIHKIAFRADGRRIAVLVGEQRIVVWDPTARRQVCVCKVPNGQILDMAFSPDGRQIAAVGGPNPEQPGEVTLFDLASGRPADHFAAHTKAASAVAFSPDGRQMITGSADATAIIWELAGHTKKLVLEDKAKQRTDRVESLHFTPDGQQVLVGYFGSAILWNATTGAKLRDFSDCNAAAFSRDGRVLAGWLGDRVVSYDLAEGKLLRVMLGHTSAVTSLAIAPGGRHLLTSSLDGTSRLWDLEKGEELIRLVAVDGGVEWVTITPDGLFDGSAGARQLVAFRVPGVDKPVPLDRFFKDFYRAGLLASIAEGQRIKAKLQLGESMPPLVKILSPGSGPVAAAEATIRVEAVDQGGGIAGVSIYQNGARLPAAGATTRKGQAVEHSFDVRLVKGQNRFRVLATNSDGSWEAEPAEITLNCEKATSDSRLYLVAVGINAYAESGLGLRFAAPDASAIAELFRRRGQPLFGNVQITALVDQDATRESIRRTLKDVASQTREEDTLVVFLAGHGAMLDQRYYFIPQELRKQAEPWEEVIRRRAIPAEELSDSLGGAKALRRALIFDTCAAGAATGALVKGHAGFELRGAMERLGRSQGIFTIAASDATQEAKESADLGHGVLSYVLLAGLKAVNQGPLAGRHVHPASPDRVVNVTEWFSFATGHVPRLTEKLYGMKQNVQATTYGNSFPVLPLED